MLYCAKVGTCEGFNFGVAACCAWVARCWRRCWRGSLLARFAGAVGCACTSAGVAVSSAITGVASTAATAWVGSVTVSSTVASTAVTGTAATGAAFNATISVWAWSIFTTKAVVLNSWRGASIKSTFGWLEATAVGACSFNTLGSRWRIGRSGRGWLRRSRRGTAFCCCSLLFWASCCCGAWSLLCWRRELRLFSRASWRCSWRDIWTTSSCTGCCWLSCWVCGSRCSLCLLLLLLWRGFLLLWRGAGLSSRSADLSAESRSVFCATVDGARYTFWLLAAGVADAVAIWPNWPRLTAPLFTICSMAAAALLALRAWSMVLACFWTNRFSNHAHGLAAVVAAAGADCCCADVLCCCAACGFLAEVFSAAGAAAWLCDWSASSKCHSEDS